MERETQQVTIRPGHWSAFFESPGMCFRCEERAGFLERGSRPRYECGDVGDSKHACYCYRPVRPVALARSRGDKRPQFGGWMFSSRSSTDRLMDGKLAMHDEPEGGSLYWIPQRVARRQSELRESLRRLWGTEVWRRKNW